MKKILICGMIFAFACGCVMGCSAKETETVKKTQEAKQNDTVSDETNSKDSEAKSEGSKAESEQKEEEEKVQELLGKCIDMEPYLEAEDAGIPYRYGTVSANQLADSVETMKVDGQEFKIGMSYVDILSAGYEPVDPEFADKETKGLAYNCDFKNSDNRTVRLGFIGEEGQKVSNGVLYSVNVSYVVGRETQNSKFETAGINESSDIEKIIASLGNPYLIIDPVYEAYTDCGLKYRCKEKNIDLTFYMDLETGKILTVVLEGYNK